MLNLKLFTQLQGAASASLLLRPSSPGRVQYFVMAASVNYSIVVSGQCEGELPSAAPISFDIGLSSLVPLLDKGHVFRLNYQGGNLKFIEVNNKFTIEPLYVEHVSDFAVDIAQRYLTTVDLLSKYEDSREEREGIQLELKQTEVNYQQASIVQKSGWVNDSPFGEANTDAEIRLQERYNERTAELKSRLELLEKDTQQVKDLELASLRRIANVAARNNTVVSMCETYALVSLKTSYIFQKVPCGVRAIQGKLLQRLLMEDTGKFYEVDGDVVFRAYAGKGEERSETFVFIQSYLPNAKVTSELITKGAVKEKYTLNLKGLLQIASAVQSKFDTMIFDMGAANLVLSNDRGEHLVHKFSVEDAKTLELNKIMRGEAGGPVVMSSVEVPREVQRILPMMRDDFVIYVKERKIVFQSGNMYIVFGK